MIRSYVEGFGLSPNLIWKLLEGLLNTLCDLGQERCFGLGFSKTPGGQGSGVCGPSPGESLWSTQCCRIWVGRAQMAKEQDPVNLILTKLIIKISIFLKYPANTLWGASIQLFCFSWQILNWNRLLSRLYGALWSPQSLTFDIVAEFSLPTEQQCCRNLPCLPLFTEESGLFYPRVHNTRVLPLK